MVQEKELLENIKQGDVFYKVTLSNITKYEYLMLYPFHNPKNVKLESYHIVLDKSLEEPKRMFYTDLITILSEGIKTYEQAKEFQIKLIEEYLEYLKAR